MGNSMRSGGRTGRTSSPAFRRGQPGATDQVLGKGDGATSLFGLRKTYASGGQTYFRAIAKPVAGTVVVAVDGVSLAAGTGSGSTTRAGRFS